MMSDKEILQVLAEVAGNTCGRFDRDQLQRPLDGEQPNHSKPYKFFLSALIPTFLFAHTGISQQNSTSYKKVKQANEKLIGKPARNEGKAVETNNDTSITSLGTVVTDNKKQICEGLSDSRDNIMMGGIQMYEKITAADRVKTYVRKAFNQNGFKIMGNPAPKGSVINLQFKKEGSYMVQFLDASGRITYTTNITSNGANGIAPVMLPNNFIPGIYFIKVTDAQKRSFTDKVSVY
jgi:hypothetical protein